MSISKKNEDASFYPAYFYVKSKDFLVSRKLSPATKDLLLLIDNLDKGKKHCWASNKYLAKNIGVDPTTVCWAIQTLEDSGLISCEGAGNKRILISHLPEENSEVLVNDRLLVNDKQPSKTNNSISNTEDSISNTEDSISNTCIIYNNIKNSIKDINSTPHSKVEIKLSKKETIEDIYEFWNGCKKSSVWWTHRKLTPEMINVIADNLKSYTIDDICSAIHNYSKVLQGDEYWWDYVWPLSIFLSVKDGKAKDAFKKWWKFLPENFVEQNYLIQKQNNSNPSYKRDNTLQQQDKLLDDPIPSFTKKLIKAHGRFTPRGWKPSITEHNKFIQATLRAQKQVDNIKESWIQNNLILDLLGALTQYYSDKGHVVSPGHYGSDFTWDTLLYQFIVGQGVNPGNLFNYTKGGDEYFDAAILEEEKLTVDTQRNIRKQNPESNKSISDTDNPELDYMLDI